MIAALRSFSNDELQKMGRRVAVVRVENKKNKEYSLTKKSVKTISDEYTSLHNAFNKILANVTNIKTLQEIQGKNQVPQTNYVPVAAKIIGTKPFSDGMNALGKIFEDLAKQLDKLDLSPDAQQKKEEDCACDVGGEAEIDIDIDKKKKRRTRRTRNRGRGRGRSRGGRGGPRGGRLGMFGKALGALGAGLDLFDRLSGGQSAVEAGVGVAGGAAGAWAGAEAGAALGALGGPAAAVTVPLGGLIGGALGYFGGSYLADKAYSATNKPSQAENELVTATSSVVAPPARREPTPISNNSYSSRFADYLKNTFQNVSSYIGGILGLSTSSDRGGGYDYSGPGQGMTENAQYALDFFMTPEGGGWAREQAAGIVANLQAESQIDPNAFNPRGGGQGAYGIAQWRGPRQTKFEELYGKPLRGSSLREQLAYVNWELTSGSSLERRAGSNLRQARSVEEATEIFYRQFERPGEDDRSGGKRIANARALMIPQETPVQASELTGGELLNPLPGVPVRSGFGMRDHPVLGGRRFHSGIDFAVKQGTPVKAAHDGTITRAENFGSYGNTVDITRRDGLMTRYAHLSTIVVRNGVSVSAGQHIGNVGSTGRSTGPHLHFEVRLNNKPTNPASYLRGADRQPLVPMSPLRSNVPAPPRRRRGDGSLLMINGQANPFMSTPPQVLFPNAGGRRAPMSVNPNSRDAMLRYHGL